MSRERQRFSIGSAHSATCVISKRWSASIWHTIKSLSLSWRQSLAQTFIRTKRRDGETARRRKDTSNENTCTKNHSAACARCAVFRGGVLLKGRRHAKTKQRRLLHLHDAPVGAFEGSWKMPHLRDGSRAGDEEGERRSYVPTARRRNKRRREKGAERRNARNARHARHERGRD